MMRRSVVVRNNQQNNVDTVAVVQVQWCTKFALGGIGQLARLHALPRASVRQTAVRQRFAKGRT